LFVVKYTKFRWLLWDHLAESPGFTQSPALFLQHSGHDLESVLDLAGFKLFRPRIPLQELEI